jgi:hypothetical protein
MSWCNPLSPITPAPRRSRLERRPATGVLDRCRAAARTVDDGVPVQRPGAASQEAGDYPPFWHKDGSFIGAMEEVYERVRTKNRQMK